MFSNSRMRAWTTAFAVVLTALCAFAAQASALPATFWGVVPQAPPTEAEFHRLKQGGVDSIRLPIPWETVQPVRNGPFNWAASDAEVAGAAKAGLSVLPFLYSAPGWAVPSTFVPGTHHSAIAPEHLPVSGVGKAGWATFVHAAIVRYGPNGTFWAENPSLPERPLRTWQVWNEENFKYFVARPNPTEYGVLVKISFAAIKAADPGAKVILGGMFARPREAQFKVKPPQAYFATDFLERMYKTNPGVKAKFNGVALHPYTSRYQLLTPEIEELRKVMKANRDAEQGPVDHRDGLELQAATRRTTSSPRASAARRRS